MQTQTTWTVEVEEQIRRLNDAWQRYPQAEAAGDWNLANQLNHAYRTANYRLWELGVQVMDLLYDPTTRTHKLSGYML